MCSDCNSSVDKHEASDTDDGADGPGQRLEDPHFGVSFFCTKREEARLRQEILELLLIE